jgi:hypothetical protein
MVTQVRYSLAERSRGWVAPCVIYTVHMETMSAGFLVEPQNHWDGFLRFGLKISGDGFSGLASKLVVMVSWLSLKTKVVEGFPVWASKPAATIW